MANTKNTGNDFCHLCDIRKKIGANSINMINQATMHSFTKIFDNFLGESSCVVSLSQVKIDENLLTTNVISQTHKVLY